jgi:hypothetical protein
MWTPTPTGYFTFRSVVEKGKLAAFQTHFFLCEGRCISLLFDVIKQNGIMSSQYFFFWQVKPCWVSGLSILEASYLGDSKCPVLGIHTHFWFSSITALWSHVSQVISLGVKVFIVNGWKTSSLETFEVGILCYWRSYNFFVAGYTLYREYHDLVKRDA